MRVHAMRSLIAGSFVILAGLTLAACATLSKQQCLQGDWRAIGYNDGADGRLMSRIDDHAKACQKTGVTPDMSLYALGREQGLMRYCTEANGFRVGRDGHAYKGVCPPPVEPEFLGGYADGERVHAAESRLASARSDLDSADARADRRARQADGVEDELRNPKLTEEQTRELRDRLHRLRRERREAIEDGRRAADAIRDAEREVDDLKARFAPRYGWW
ncbi:DUF2799 domain-containing protein [Caulobacter segnis]|uniref:DUF2799 domain-containing protein n=1 Tax=Caulobacter segnis TaxID=88688 RepID=A0A2W5V986_9CAUL|nr:DUF2799 domain-containing protein [Caulobacter segnis]PZR34473.1 MAG: hypothetical protein DI526_10175 [Caulobacter segnis]